MTTTCFGADRSHTWDSDASTCHLGFAEVLKSVITFALKCLLTHFFEIKFIPRSRDKPLPLMKESGSWKDVFLELKRPPTLFSLVYDVNPILSRIARINSWKLSSLLNYANASPSNIELCLVVCTCIARIGIRNV